MLAMDCKVKYFSLLIIVLHYRYLIMYMVNSYFHKQIVFESFNKKNIINMMIGLNTYFTYSYYLLFLILVKSDCSPQAWESDIETYTFLLSCVMNIHYLGTMTSVFFLWLKISATWIIFSLGTQTFLGPFLLVLKALDYPIFARCLHLDVMCPIFS